MTYEGKDFIKPQTKVKTRTKRHQKHLSYKQARLRLQYRIRPNKGQSGIKVEALAMGFSGLFQALQQSRHTNSGMDARKELRGGRQVQ